MSEDIKVRRIGGEDTKSLSTILSELLIKHVLDETGYEFRVESQADESIVLELPLHGVEGLRVILSIGLEAADGDIQCRFRLEASSSNEDHDLQGGGVDRILFAIRKAVGQFVPEFLCYDEKELRKAVDLKLTDHQIISLNRLVKRWRRRPDDIRYDPMLEVLMVTYGNLLHGIETDGYCHT